MSSSVLLGALSSHPTATFAVLCGIAVLIPHAWAFIKSFIALRNIPTIGLDGFSIQAFKRAKHRYTTDALNLSLEGYKKYTPGGVYKMWSKEGFRVVISPDLIEEFKNCPDDVMDFFSIIIEDLGGEHMGFLMQGEKERIKMIRVETLKSLEATLPVITDEVNYGIEKYIGECEEWTSVTIYQTMLNIVSLISGRIIIGSPENRKDSWVKFAGNYTRDTFKGGMLLRSYPVLFRPLAARFIPEVKRCTFHKETAIKIVKPIFEERMLELDKKNLPNDGLQWIINSTAPENRNAEYLSHEVRMFVFASVFTTTQNSVELIHSLIAHPEYIQPLREEAARVLGEGEGIFTRQGIRKMELMDSFMNETIRHGSANAFSMTRVVTSPKGFTFKNGMHLPQGTRVNGIPSGAISMDPKIWDNPEEFDGYRFLKLRQAERDTNKHAFTSHTLFLFGAGKHVCPGRFLAEAEIKIVTAIFLLNFDIRAKDVRTRISVEGFKIPDVTTRIDFRRRIQ